MFYTRENFVNDCFKNKKYSVFRQFRKCNLELNGIKKKVNL